MKAMASSGTGLSAALAVWGMVACGGAPPVPACTTAGLNPEPPATSPTPAMPSSAIPSPSSSSTTSSAEPSTATTPPYATTDVWGHPTGDTKASVHVETDLSNLSDAQLAEVVMAVDDGEIRLAQLGMVHATTPAVKHFAHEIQVAYEGMLSKDNDLWSRLQLAPATSPASKKLDTDIQEQAARIATVSKADFDHEYVAALVRAQNKVLNVLDAVVANARSTAFKADLTARRPKLEGHLRMAQTAQEQEQKGVTNLQPSGSSTPNSKP
jgi:predicted outer membrane protein